MNGPSHPRRKEKWAFMTLELIESVLKSFNNPIGKGMKTRDPHPNKMAFRLSLKKWQSDAGSKHFHFMRTTKAKGKAFARASSARSGDLST